MLSRFDSAIADARRRLATGDLEGAARAHRIARGRSIRRRRASPELGGRLAKPLATTRRLVRARERLPPASSSLRIAHNPPRTAATGCRAAPAPSAAPGCTPFQSPDDSAPCRTARPRGPLTARGAAARR